MLWCHGASGRKAMPLLNRLVLVLALALALCALERAQSHSREPGYWHSPAYHPELIAPAPSGTGHPLAVVTWLPSQAVSNVPARNQLRSRDALLAGVVALG